MRINRGIGIVFAVIASVALLLGVTGVAYGATQSSSSNAAAAKVQTQMHRMQLEQRHLQAEQNSTAIAENSAAITRLSNQMKRVGICYSVDYYSADGDYGTYADQVSIDQPVSTNGVTTCPSGDTFVPVTPSATTTP
jgi:hypothetical protein